VPANADLFKGKTLEAGLPKIELRYISKYDGGASTGEIILQIMDEVSGAAGTDVASINIG